MRLPQSDAERFERYRLLRRAAASPSVPPQTDTDRFARYRELGAVRSSKAARPHGGSDVTAASTPVVRAIFERGRGG
ncbi:hypothetical protein MOX02_45070 [Methylobacterium oxalidis]|uniref:Uncharacterized protein n=1 Tax=Methylobacterium oxalidis TaxID=944322 RepID=A0A512J9D2_9HYPH|nr:hypothetical protein MOX02_45070 [Methylobacterium oxalidis]GLS65509.1 hypothetical protein GCM10007888_38910 [Methylobacterium oxalidis]